MQKISTKLFVATFISLLLVGCSKDDETTDESKVPTEFSPSTELALAFKDGIDVNADGATIELSFSTNKSWSITTEQGWCKITPNKGKSDNDKFSIYISPNESFDNRESILTFRTGEIQDYIHIRQQGLRVAYINMVTAGTLRKTLGENEKHIVELHISGDINGDDINFIEEWKLYAPTVNKILDLGKANIVNGGSYTSIFDSDRIQRSAKANTISNYMFYGGLLKELILPQTVTTIEDHAVYVGNLTKLVLPEKLEKIGNRSVSYMSELKELTIPEHLSSVGEYSLFGFKNITELQLPTSLRNIGKGAFSMFPNVKQFILPEGLEKLDDTFFSGWDALEYVWFPSTLKELGGLCLANLDLLKEIHFSSVYPPKSYFYFFNDSISIYVPKGSLENYRKDEVLGRFKNIIEE